MIFKLKKRKKPVQGDTKQVTKFAFFPVRINDETIIWFEKYHCWYEYILKEFNIGPMYGWKMLYKDFYKK